MEVTEIERCNFAIQAMRLVPIYPKEATIPEIREAGDFGDFNIYYIFSSLGTTFPICLDKDKYCFPDKEAKERGLSQFYAMKHRIKERHR